MERSAEHLGGSELGPAGGPWTGPVVVAGANGRTGVHVVAELLACDLPVRALVRDPARASRLDSVDPGRWAERVATDVRDPEALLAALAGAGAVICTIGTTTFWGPNGARAVDHQGVAALAAAAAATPGIGSVVLVSSLGATRTWHVLNAANRLLHRKLEGENALRASGAAYTVVRPGALNDAPGGRALRLTQGDQVRGESISRADVARVCVDALLDPHARNTTFEVVAAHGAPAPLAAQLARLRPDRPTAASPIRDGAGR